MRILLPLIFALSACHVVVDNTNACTDGLFDGNETDLDCGGSCAACGNGRGCARSSDCLSGFCGPTGFCAAVVVSQLPDSTGAPVYNIDPGVGAVVAPGSQAGYGITASAGGSYRVFWTGDAQSSGTYREFTGQIWTTGTFDTFTPGCSGVCPIETNDAIDSPVAVSGGEVITFDTFATDGLDGLDFSVTHEPVYFDLRIDGQLLPQLVFFSAGGIDSNAGSIPFGLTTQ